MVKNFRWPVEDIHIGRHLGPCHPIRKPGDNYDLGSDSCSFWLLSKRRKPDPNVQVRNKLHQGGTGKRGIWFLLFLDREFYCNTGKSLKTRGKYFDCNYD